MGVQDQNGNVVEAVPVPGGRLAVEVLSSASEPVLAVHGISSQRKLWNWLHEAEPGISLIAPDLRGRGASVDVAGPSSIARHAADMIAVLDHLGLRSAHVCGMSMGGFVAVELAVMHPDRVKSLILLDGGFPMAAPAGLTREQLPVLFRDRLARLEQEWPSVGHYAAFFVASTAPLLDPADPLLLDYLEHDLQEARVRLSADALVSDSADIFFGLSRWQQITVPTRLLTAEWSVGQDSAPAYSDEAVNGFRAALPDLLTVRQLRAADHAATVMSRPGARASAAEILAALGQHQPARPASGRWRGRDN
jgi:pimeloyl-ACP methyl ester carboxylesterase